MICKIYDPELDKRPSRFSTFDVKTIPVFLSIVKLSAMLSRLFDDREYSIGLLIPRSPSTAATRNTEVPTGEFSTTLAIGLTFTNSGG